MMRRCFIIILGLLCFSLGCHKNEDKDSPTEPEAQPEPGEYYVDIYDANKTCEGTTLFTDGHDTDNMKVVEVDMQGQIVWEFILPQAWVNPPIVGFDAELLNNGNILIVGVMTDIDESVIFEVTPDKEIVWQLRLYQTPVLNRPGHFFKAQRLCSGG